MPSSSEGGSGPICGEGVISSILEWPWITWLSLTRGPGRSSVTLGAGLGVAGHLSHLYQPAVEARHLLADSGQHLNRHHHQQHLTRPP